MRLSDLPPGVSQFDEHINPSESPERRCDDCGHWKVEHRKHGRSDGELGWCLAYLGQPNECECQKFVPIPPKPMRGLWAREGTK